MIRIAITGASGFVGGHLLRAFEGRAGVAGFSRRAGGDAGLVPIADYADMPAADVLVHLAETNSRVAAEQDGAAHERAAVSTIERLIATGFGRIVYVSSAAVYGDGSTDPHQVTDTVRASDAYTRAKLACEARVLAVDGTVARVANLFGIGMSPHNVISAILAQIPGDDPVRVLDDTPIRDFLWIEDAAQALSLMAEQPRPGIYNIGTGIGTSVRELVRAAAEAADQSTPDIVATARSGRASCNIVDIAATTAAFGWAPRHSIRDGMRRLVADRMRQPA